MKKIMFENRRFGLEDAVLAGMKTMTRRIIKLPDGVQPDDVTDAVMGIDDKGRVFYAMDTKNKQYNIYPHFQPGEVVAIAQSYKSICECMNRDDRHKFELDVCVAHEGRRMCGLAGKDNKMYVRADLMPNRINITDLKAERLQDISDEDCRREGIIHLKWKQWLEQDILDFSPQKYKLWDVWSLPKFEEGIMEPFAESEPNEFAATDPHTAFAVLIFKLMSRKVWEQNPWVFGYEFELNK